MERLLSSSTNAAGASSSSTPSSASSGRELVKVGGGDAWALAPAPSGHRGAPLVMQGHAFVSGRPKSQSAVSMLIHFSIIAPNPK